MFLNRVKLVMTAAAVAAALAAGAVALAQSGIGSPKDGSGKPRHVGSPSWTYHILVSRDGEPPRKVAVVEMTGDTPIRVDAPGALILIQPRRDGEPDHQAAAGRRNGDIRVGVTGEKTGRSPADSAADRPIELVGPTSRNQDAAKPSGANSSRSENDQEHRKVVLTSPKAMDVAITQRYVCRIHSHRHINVRALQNGYLNEISVREGQAVKKGDLMFKIVPILSKAKPDAEPAKVVAPFDGIIDRLHEPQGSLIKEGDILTTLSDNSVMWVYFNVPERQYLEYMAHRKQHEADKIELVLADQTKFPQPGRLGAIEAEFNHKTGTIAFRADFPNPDGLLRHGQTGTILIHRNVPDAIVIPQRATHEILDKWYVYVVDKDSVVHRREIDIQHELDDSFVIERGVGVGDRIVLEGMRQVRDGEKVEYEFRPPQR